MALQERNQKTQDEVSHPGAPKREEGSVPRDLLQASACWRLLGLEATVRLLRQIVDFNKTRGRVLVKARVFIKGG